MLSLDAPEWKSFEGGYRTPFDASILLAILAASDQPDEDIWNELWENLYHQGDVGVASYATVPQVARIYENHGWLDLQLPNFVNAVEDARRSNENPDVPGWLELDYFAALRSTAVYCVTRSQTIQDPHFNRALLMLIAAFLKEKGIYDLLDLVEIGDESKALQLYQDSTS